MASGLANAVLDVLPQTQCRRCGYADCGAYAEAIVAAGAPINRCPPGGAEGIARLAVVTRLDPLPLDIDCGAEGPRQLALIDESACIGCALCLRACPVDAIVGAAKQMHVVIAAACTGCELCVPACPVDCIALVGASGERRGWAAWSQAEADQARARYARHAAREANDVAPRVDTQGSGVPSTRQPPAAQASSSAVDALIADAFTRARARRPA